MYISGDRSWPLQGFHGAWLRLFGFNQGQTEGVAWVESAPRVIERGLLEGGALKNTLQILLRECFPLLEALAEDVLPSPKSLERIHAQD